MVYMNNFISFILFVFFNEDNTYPYLLCFSLTFDFIIYNTYFINTLFFTTLYVLNRRIKTKHNIFIYLLRNIINITFGLFFYSILNNILLPFNNIILIYLINIIISTIIFCFHHKTLVIKY